MTAHGLHDGTTDPRVVKCWWASDPYANVATVTGPDSGFWVVGPDGPEGLADLERLIAQNGPLPATARVRSGSGGEHLLFCWPADGLPIPNRRNHRGTKIDIRGQGNGPGYIVAPPSTNANGAYLWLDDREPAEAPGWLLDWARGSSMKAIATARPSVVERAKLYLDRCPPAVSGQNGHGQTFTVARALVWGFELPEAQALDLLQTHYNPRCEPPWSDAELLHKLRDAGTAPFDKPRGYLLGEDFEPTHKSTSNSRDTRDVFQGERVSCAGWGAPAPLPSMPAVPAFPLEVIPGKVAHYWKAAAKSLGVPVDFLAVPGLVLLGAAVGRSRAAAVKTSYHESPLLWAAVIGPPGSAKSAALRMARAPLQKAEARWLEEHRKELEFFDTEMDRYSTTLKTWKAEGCKGEPPTKPRRPTLRQATLDDATAEATAKVLGDNPRGVAVIKDELIAFVRSMGQYKSGGAGSDRQFWLSCWAGSPAKVSRAKDHDKGPLVVPHPFVGIAGMMCPDSLPELRGDLRGESPGDGFIDRFLLSFPDILDATGETWDTVPEDVAQDYADAFLDLLSYDLLSAEEGGKKPRDRPYFVSLTPDGKAAWEEFTQEMARRKNALDPFEPYRGVLAKLQGYAMRLVGLLWCLRRSAGELMPNDLIDAETMRNAATLVRYFDEHARRCLGIGWADRSARIAARLLTWLARHPEMKAFTRTQAFLALKDRRDVKSSQALDPAFRVLADHNYLRMVDRHGNGKPGPVPEVLLVNPDWIRPIPE